eukprot:GHVL01016377.1.p1 GENE.GHVL01016377.1~~GHVL01016377.1.p1  ORF type:complete len:283 (+),score=5.89 GHVL01016377.1:1726-2574(+)
MYLLFPIYNKTKNSIACNKIYLMGKKLTCNACKKLRLINKKLTCTRVTLLMKKKLTCNVCKKPRSIKNSICPIGKYNFFIILLFFYRIKNNKNDYLVNKFKLGKNYKFYIFFLRLPGQFLFYKYLELSPCINHVIKLELRNKYFRFSSTKTKSDVKGSGKKPWKQKGTGKSRAGTKRSPLWRGGGINFGPDFENFKTYKINRKLWKITFFYLVYSVKSNILCIFGPLHSISLIFFRIGSNFSLKTGYICLGCTYTKFKYIFNLYFLQNCSQFLIIYYLYIFF